MSHTITAAAKLTVMNGTSTLATLHTDIQTALRTLANGDKIIDIIVEKDIHSNKCVICIVYEDQ